MKNKTNSQNINALIKDLKNTPYEIGLALLVERLLKISTMTLQGIEQNPKDWENPFVSLEMYKDLCNKINNHLK